MLVRVCCKLDVCKAALNPMELVVLSRSVDRIQEDLTNAKSRRRCAWKLVGAILIMARFLIWSMLGTSRSCELMND
jgi:hypothetical protein